MRRIGLLGGTFDPIHNGHLALAHAAQTALQLDELRFMPAGQPWQKQALQTPAAHRIAMVECALADEQPINWRCDTRETLHHKPTYTIDTLRSLRAELGADVSLIWLCGADQLLNLPSWKDWTQLFELAHFAYAERNLINTSATSFSPALARMLALRLTPQLPDTPCGSIVPFAMPPVGISSTHIRQICQSPENVQNHLQLLVPMSVLAYIQTHHLYLAPQ